MTAIKFAATVSPLDWNTHVAAQSLLLLFSAEAINLDPVTGPQGADSSHHRRETGHKKVLQPIRRGVTNTEAPGCSSPSM